MKKLSIIIVLGIFVNVNYMFAQLVVDAGEDRIICVGFPYPNIEENQIGG